MTSDPRTGTDAREAARAAVLRSREAHRMSYASVARDDQPEQYRCVCGDAHSGPGSLAKGRHHDAVTSADAVLAALAAAPSPSAPAGSAVPVPASPTPTEEEVEELFHAPLTGPRRTIHHPGEHKRMNDDGVDYCGWAGDGGIYHGCGEAWPCSTVRASGSPS